MIFKHKVPQAYREQFLSKVSEVANRLGINPNWLMAVMYFESAGTFSPSVGNHHTGAVGLIQFMPRTAQALGTTVTALAQMSAVEQLEFVYKYFAPYKSKIRSYTDLYLVTFFPLAVGKSDDFVLKTNSVSPQLIAKQNPIFDLNKDNIITVGEIKKVMLSRIPQEWKNVFSEKKNRFY